MTGALGITPIGYVRGGRVEAIDDDWGDVECTIELDADQFGPDVLAGLDAFSHVEIVYIFHLVADEEIETGARHPREREDWPLVGIFSQRGKGRPNRVGTTTCEIVSIDGLSLRVRGLDAIDGTPVIDIKPFMTAFAPRSAVREPVWAKELMADYWHATEHVDW
ncbi:MAG: tRNA (adenine37-N6)-methyltransferase [Actinomycetota bacterium]